MAEAEKTPEQKAKILIIYSHPSIAAEGKCARVLERIKTVYSAEQVQFNIIDLYRESFNPVLTENELASYWREPPAVPPADVARCQKMISESDVLVFIYPIWWSSPPAMLKGFIDRVFTPGFAYKFKGEKMEALLTGKRALVVRTFAGGAEHEQVNGHVSTNFMDKVVLGGCGITPNSIDLYSMESVEESTFKHQLFQIEGAARRILVKPTGVPHHLRWIPAPYLPPVTGKPKRQEKQEEQAKPENVQAARDFVDAIREEQKGKAASRARERAFEKSPVFGTGKGTSDAWKAQQAARGRQPTAAPPQNKPRLQPWQEGAQARAQRRSGVPIYGDTHSDLQWKREERRPWEQKFGKKKHHGKHGRDEREGGQGGAAPGGNNQRRNERGGRGENRPNFRRNKQYFGRQK